MTGTPWPMADWVDDDARACWFVTGSACDVHADPTGSDPTVSLWTLPTGELDHMSTAAARGLACALLAAAGYADGIPA